MTTIKTQGIKSPLIAKTKKLRDATGAATKVAAVASIGLHNDLIPDVKIVMRAIGDLTPAKVRNRKTEPEHLEALIKGISQFKFVGAILTKGDSIVDGHVRIEALTALQEKMVPCIDVGHLSDEQTRLLSISFNRIGETGTWDLDALRLETLELDALGLDLSVTGFSLPRTGHHKAGSRTRRDCVHARFGPGNINRDRVGRRRLLGDGGAPPDLR